MYINRIKYDLLMLHLHMVVFELFLIVYRSFFHFGSYFLQNFAKLKIIFQVSAIFLYANETYRTN